MTTAESYAHTLRTSAIGLGPAAEVHIEVERKDGPASTDTLLTLSRDQAALLVKNLVQCIQDTNPRGESYP